MPAGFKKSDGAWDAQFQGYEYFYFPMDHDEFADHGVIGNPMRASAEKGDQIFDRFARHLAEALAERLAKVKALPAEDPAAEIAACRWLPDEELAVYATEYQRTGFQGGLNWYRSRSGGAFESELQLFSGRSIDVPSIFVSGTSDWGVYQTPGAVERMQGTACTNMVGCHLLDGAGHWVQQEQAAKVSELLVGFLKGH